MEYVTYDYEEPGAPDNYWHIYTLDNEPEGVDFGGATLLTIVAPETEEMRQAVAAICQSINAAISIASKQP
jgi:hypothetical protein